MAKPITEKQAHAIKFIEKFLNIKFEGSTRQDAFLWLREYVPKAVEIEQKEIEFRNSQGRSINPWHEYNSNRIDHLDLNPNIEEERELEISTCKWFLGI